ncbi:hypothetical protein, partial [Parafrankia sp. BMG5.11]|uniref:hypothetical protein n=1 Tax=Parafrankia sp. BMG5.11 TaxID=222540 RepID=UPI001FB49A29
MQEVVQPLPVRAGDQSGQLGQRLVALPGQQQADQILPQRGALSHATEQVIEVAAEPVDRLRRRRGRLAGQWRCFKV